MNNRKNLKRMKERARITRKNYKLNKYTWGNLDTRERRDGKLTREYLNDAPEELENESWKLRMKNHFEMMASLESKRKESWNALVGYGKNYHNPKQLWEDGIKLEYES